LSVRVWSTPEADAQARAAAAWWRENRQASADLFYRELFGAVDLLATVPEIGRSYPEAGVPGLRRLLLPRTRYHVYDADQGEVAILAVWSAIRGPMPKFD